MSNSSLTSPHLDALIVAAKAVPDPEIPVLSLGDLGVIRDVRIADDGSVDVDMTPTYSGCPATAVMAQDVTTALRACGASEVRVRTVLSPAWTSDWISEEGREKLRGYGIAPPGRATLPLATSVRCPRCDSSDTIEVSRFGSTPCKSLWTCRSCSEPFDFFKAI
ncbi:MAG: 1,2-phenylacetyl-CoA epoxidase subunit PaaD [Dermatophilaceae bacterium]